MGDGTAAADAASKESGSSSDVLCLFAKGLPKCHIQPAEERVDSESNPENQAAESSNLEQKEHGEQMDFDGETEAKAEVVAEIEAENCLFDKSEQ